MYCVAVVVTGCSIKALSLVAVNAMLSMSPLNDLLESSAGIAPGGGTWTRTLLVVGRTSSSFCEIPWMFVAAFAELNRSVEGLEWRMTCSSASCASWKWDFQFYQYRLSRVKPSNLCRSSGNLFSARREWDATATSHASKIARPACVVFLCASSQRVMNSGTLGSSTH